MQYKICELSLLDKKTLIETGLKLSEETGELAEALLSTGNAYACGYKNVDPRDVLLEAADCVIVASSVAYKAGYTVEEFEQAVLEKLEKWKQKVAHHDTVNNQNICEGQLAFEFNS